MKPVLMSRRGLTLVEMLVVLPIMLVLFGGIFFVLSQAGYGTWLMSTAELETQTDAQRALDRIAEDLRGASAAQVRCPVATGPLEMGVDGGADEVVYTYDAAANTLTRTVGGATPVVVGSRLQDFSCTAPVNQVVTLSVNSQVQTSKGLTIQQTLDTDVKIQLP